MHHAAGNDSDNNKSIYNFNVAGNPTRLTSERPADSNYLPVPPSSQLVPAVPTDHVHHQDLLPLVVPRPYSLNQPLLPAIPSSAQEVDSGVPGEGGGQTAPGGRPCGGADCQLSAFPLLSVACLAPPVTVVQSALSSLVQLD